jgi:hypothetical protein
MELRLERNPRDTAEFRRGSNEAVILIRKLRWIGLEEKAERLEAQLERCEATDAVIAEQSDTD